MTEECPVCVNTMDDPDDILECPGCQFRVCGTCFRQTILTQERDPTCMNCKKEISTEYILEMNPRTWLMNHFLPHMGHLLMEKERLLIPYTQDEAAAFLKAKRIRQEIARLPTDSQLKRRFGKNNFLEEKKMKDAIKMELRYQINKDKKSTSSTSMKKTLPIAKCRKEGCQGFINTQFMCVMCETRVCKECLCQTNEDHTCTKEDLDLAIMLRKESKPCPKCFTPIIKAGGCDQMFCTSCNTPFSWITGKIQTGPVHNPHYYEWLASRGAVQEGDMQLNMCNHNDLPREFTIQRAVGWVPKIMTVYRHILHVIHVELPQYAEDRVKDNIDLRIGFIIGDITEEKWKSTLIHRERTRLKNRAYRGVLETFVTVATDLFIRLVSTRDTNTFVRETIELMHHIIPCERRLPTIYGGSIPYFFNDFEIINNRLHH